MLTSGQADLSEGLPMFVRSIAVAAAALCVAVSSGVSAQNAPKTPDTIDQSANDIVKAQLTEGVKKYGALRGSAIIMNAQNGEIVATAAVAKDPSIIAIGPTEGIYEVGGLLKTATIAMGLETGSFTINSKIDAKQPLKIGQFKIGDYEAQNKVLTVPEVLLNSSNIASAKIGLKVGANYQTLFLKSLGLYDVLSLGTEKSGLPIYSNTTTPIVVATRSFGHGIAVTPVHVVSAMATLTSVDGRVVYPTFRKEHVRKGFSVVSPKVTSEIRDLLRLNVEKGRGLPLMNAGLKVGGIGATAEKIYDGRYSKDRLITSMIAIVPFDIPKYIYFVVLDEPQNVSGKSDNPTSMLNAAPLTAEIIASTKSTLGIIQ